MYEYDMPNSRESGYHRTYLKMVGVTIALKPEVGRFTIDYHRFTTDTLKYIYMLLCICGKSVVVYGKSAHLSI